MVTMIVDEQRTKVQREPRRELRKRPTWMTVDDGVTKIECFVLDVSPGGAKVMTDAALDVRDGFQLALVPGAHDAPVVRSGLAPGQDLRRKIRALRSPSSAGDGSGQWLTCCDPAYVSRPAPPHVIPTCHIIRRCTRSRISLIVIGLEL